MSNPYKHDLGVVVGKFAPLTQGHINLINEAAAACKHTLVVLSYDSKWLSEQNERDQKRLTKLNRLRWLEQTFKDTPHVSVTCLDESHLKAYPNGWEKWSSLLEMTVREAMGAVEVIIPGILGEKLKELGSVAIYSSENEYDENYKKYLPEWDHIVVDNDRTQVPISATMIRENIYKYWEYLPSIVRTDYAIKVMVTGTEAVGKTSLVKALAKLFNTSWCEEYGRVYCENVLGSELTLRPSDYPIIAFQHKVNQLQDLSHANKVCFFDTGTFSTLFFHVLYSRCDTITEREEFGKVSSILSSICEQEEWDIVLELSTEVPWVDDGMRVNSDREKTTYLWTKLKKQYPNQFPEGRTYQITGETYQERLHQAKDIIFKVMDEFCQPKPAYEMDDGPVTREQIDVINKMTGLGDAKIDEGFETVSEHQQYSQELEKTLKDVFPSPLEIDTEIGLSEIYNPESEFNKRHPGLAESFKDPLQYVNIYGMEAIKWEGNFILFNTHVILFKFMNSPESYKLEKIQSDLYSNLYQLVYIGDE